MPASTGMSAHAYTLISGGGGEFQELDMVAASGSAPLWK
jgi:hypothetical protein